MNFACGAKVSAHVCTHAIGTAEDGSAPLTVAAQTWESQNGVANITGDTVNHIFGAQGTQITYKEADRLLAVEIDKSGSAEANKGLNVRLETRLKGNEQMEGSVKNSIAKVIPAAPAPIIQMSAERLAPFSRLFASKIKPGPFLAHRCFG